MLSKGLNHADEKIFPVMLPSGGAGRRQRIKLSSPGSRGRPRSCLRSRSHRRRRRPLRCTFSPPLALVARSPALKGSSSSASSLVGSMGGPRPSSLRRSWRRRRRRRLRRFCSSSGVRRSRRRGNLTSLSLSPVSDDIHTPGPVRKKRGGSAVGSSSPSGAVSSSLALSSSLPLDAEKYGDDSRLDGLLLGDRRSPSSSGKSARLTSSAKNRRVVRLSALRGGRRPTSPCCGSSRRLGLPWGWNAEYWPSASSCLVRPAKTGDEPTPSFSDSDRFVPP
mmetsp:Transcript_12004/g.34665  ORF Transcript_12004/g.34665 Transcript_12004/m.34665 type:complete len:278 (+) Transcript_12004:2410-3243(+)